MSKRFWKGFAAAFAISATTAIGAAPAGAQDVNIRTMAGGMAITGQLVEFDSEFLTIRSQMGLIRIRRELAICEGPGCPQDQSVAGGAGEGGEVIISGSSSIGAKLLPRLLEGFAAETQSELALQIDPVARELVTTLTGVTGELTGVFRSRLRTTSEAVQDLLAGRVNMIVTSRRITDAEAAQFNAAGIGDIRDPRREVVVALDGLALVVAPNNPVTTMTIEQVADVVAGRIVNWSDLGGPDAPIGLYLPPSEDDALQVFNGEILRPLRLRPSRDADQSLSGEAIATRVADSGGAIGLATLSQSGPARPVVLEQSCGLLVQPDAFSIKAEEYPLARRIYIYTSAPILRGAAGAFHSYVQSQSGQSGVREVGFVDQNLVSRTVNEQGLRFVSAIVSDQSEANIAQLQEMAQQIQTAERLSVTLRFNPGSTTLQPKSLVDIDRLIDMLTAPENADRDVLLLGFTDNVGRPDINQILSGRRASEVRDAILAAAQGRIAESRLTALGYGPIAPIGCNDNPRGRETNRRVEVWLQG
ncbi:MAG: phosphate ABC transporter substrate-binding/OmpA family protein [Pseudomonadota bacterium]